MDSYLKKKGVKFEDERLNCAIDTIAVAHGAKKKLDLLINNLTQEAIEAINSKIGIGDIPVKNGFNLMSGITSYNDPSYLGTMQIMELEKDGIVYRYEFKLAYFHNKSYISDNIGTFYMYEWYIDDEGNEQQTEISDSIVSYNLVSKADTSFLKGEGIYTDKEASKFPSLRVHMPLDDLLADKREILHDREYYKKLDKEITRLYYPSFYSYYNSESCSDFCEVQTELMDIIDQFYHERNEKEGSFFDEIYYMVTEGNKKYTSYVKNYLSYEDWCLKNKIKIDEGMFYEDWVKVKDSIEKIDIEEVQNRKDSLDDEEKVYSYYNPNKIRYDEDEEEEKNIESKVVNKKRR